MSLWSHPRPGQAYGYLPLLVIVQEKSHGSMNIIFLAIIYLGYDLQGKTTSTTRKALKQLKEEKERSE